MTDRYAVIGNPIAHSRSPDIHSRFARATGEDIAYERLLAPVGGFRQAALRFRDEGGRGLNVTLPFKLDAFALAGLRSARAEAAGAVNLLAFDGDRIYGDNTDGTGLVRDVELRLGVPLADRSVMLLGAGGAARGAIRPMLDAGVGRIAIANRNAQRARDLAAAMNDTRISGCGLDEIGALLERGEEFELLVNATSTGLADAALPVPGALFAAAQLAYDMVYAAQPTRFMAQASAAGCPQVSDGLGMLVEQAAESFARWRGTRPDTREALARLTVPLS